MTQVIQITISPAGETTVETRGFAGASCQQASRFLEQALGRTVGERLTSEFYHQPIDQSARTEQRS